MQLALRAPGLATMAASCTREGRVLRIAYNNESMPYFDLKHGRADTDTLEGAILEIFLERHKINPVYMYGNYEWGSLDPDTGRWTGVVGKTPGVDVRGGAGWVRVVGVSLDMA